MSFTKNDQAVVLNRESLQYLANCIRLVHSLPDLLNDVLPSQTTTYSSYKVTELLNTLNTDLQNYVNNALGNLSHLKKEIVSVAPTDNSADEDTIYLVQDASGGYEQYLKINGVVTSLGSTSAINNVYTKTESDGKFALLSTLNSLITTVGGLNDLTTTDKTSIVNAINELKTDLTTHTNDTDIHITSSERDKWNSYNTTINEMKTNFQDGVNTIYDSVVAKGVTPTDKSPSSIVEALDKTFNNSILIKEYSSDGLKIYNNRGIIEEGGYYKDEKYKICYVNVICLSKVDLDYNGGGNECLLLISGLPMPLIQNKYSNPTFLSIENIDNPNRQCKAGYGIDKDGINGCIFMNPFNNNERVRIYGAYQYSES